MKKPVMAIDMRRTATVLDFAVAIVSRRARNFWLRASYLSSPSCDLEWTMRAIRVSLFVGMEGERQIGGSGAENFRFGIRVMSALAMSCELHESCTKQIYDIVFSSRTICYVFADSIWRLSRMKEVSVATLAFRFSHRD